MYGYRATRTTKNVIYLKQNYRIFYRKTTQNISKKIPLLLYLSFLHLCEEELRNFSYLLQ